MTDKVLRRTTKSAILLLCLFLLFSFSPIEPEAFSPQVIQIGATGDDVIELQARLQYIGYYKGKIDGVFGWGTYWAVRNFQHDFGLEVDGLVGLKVKQKLVNITDFDAEYVYGEIYKGRSPQHYGPGRGRPEGPPPGQRKPPGQPGRQAQPGQPTQPGRQAQPAQPQVGQAEQGVNLPEGFSANDLQLMANAVYGEARGEPYEGQVAIAAVILNRVKDPRFPNTVSGVIFEPLAFTAVADGQMWLEPNETAKRAVQDAVNGWDPTGGLVYYYNPVTATSQWMFNKQVVKRIGKHVFVR